MTSRGPRPLCVPILSFEFEVNCAKVKIVKTQCMTKVTTFGTRKLPFQRQIIRPDCHHGAMGLFAEYGKREQGHIFILVSPMVGGIIGLTLLAT